MLLKILMHYWNSDRMNLMKKQKYTAQKNEILEKARDLFWKKGYDGTSLKDIAAACGQLANEKG